MRVDLSRIALAALACALVGGAGCAHAPRRSGAFVRSAATSAARPSAARRPFGSEPLGAKKKRRFRGGLDWDDNKLYDEWIKSGAPGGAIELDDAGEIDLDSPPDAALASSNLRDEDFELDLAAQLLNAPVQRGGGQPSRLVAPAAPIDRAARAMRERDAMREEAAIAETLQARVQQQAQREQQASSAQAPALPPPPPTPSEARATSSSAAAGATYTPPDRARATPIPDPAPPPPLPLDLIRAAAADEEAASVVDAAKAAAVGDEIKSSIEMDGWVRQGYSWVRDPSADAASLAARPRPPRMSVPVPPSMRSFVLAREAGEFKQPLLWPETHWRAAWVTAVDARQHRCLKATWANFNVQIAHNFADVPALADDAYGLPEPEGSGPSEAVLTLAEEAIMKAEMAFAITGLPAIADASSVELLANPNARSDKRYIFRGEMSGRVDELMLKLRPLSAPNRVALFHTVVAFTNGTHRMFGDGMCAAGLLIANSSMAVISRSGAYDDILEKLARSFSLAFTGPNVEVGGRSEIVLPNEQRQVGREMQGSRMLRERILRDGKLLDSGILKVSSFLNHQVDVGLIEACGEELAVRLECTMPNKILTVEATGLIPAIFVARQLNVPVVFARKQRPLTISDAYTVSYRSATKGTLSELIVSEEYLNAGDRVLLIDDFLAGGSTAEALFKLIKMANAKVVGMGVLIEKLTDSGRAFLSGYEVPVESLVKVRGLETGRIDVVDEPPFVVPGSRGDAAESSAQGGQARPM